MPGPMAEVTIRIGTGLLAGLPVCRLKCLPSCCLTFLPSWPMAVLIHWWPYAFSPWIYSFFPPLLLRPAPLNTAISGSFGNSAHSIQGEESDNQGCVSPWKKRMLFFFFSPLITGHHLLFSQKMDEVKIQNQGSLERQQGLWKVLVTTV